MEHNEQPFIGCGETNAHQKSDIQKQWTSYKQMSSYARQYYEYYVLAAQPRFQSWGSNSLVYGITTLLHKKLDRSTQFGAVGYTITLYSSKSYVKSWRSVQILVRSW